MRRYILQAAAAAALALGALSSTAPVFADPGGGSGTDRSQLPHLRGQGGRVTLQHEQIDLGERGLYPSGVERIMFGELSKSAPAVYSVLADAPPALLADLHRQRVGSAHRIHWRNGRGHRGSTNQ